MSLTQTWGLLVGLTALSTVLAAAGSLGPVALAAILILAWIKAHLILRDYLGLHRSPQVLRGFDTMLGLVMMAMLTLAWMA